MKPVGGEIELDINLINHPKNKNDYLLRHGFTVNGRAAIKLALQTFNCSKIFLLPSYLCESIIQPFKELLIPFEFYRINDDLSIDLDHLSYSLEKYDVGGIFKINYFGMICNEETTNFLLDLKKSLWIIEDYSHGTLIESKAAIKNYIGHIVISSLRKYLPVPDGCIIINNSSLKLPTIKAETNEFSRIRTIAKLLRWEFCNPKIQNIQKELEKLFLVLFSVAEDNVNQFIEIQKMSYFSEIILSSIDLENIKTKRRENFNFLISYFKNSSTLKEFCVPIYKVLGDSSPFCFPIRIANIDRDTLRRKLVSENCFCSVLWPLPIEISKTEFLSSYRLSNTIMCIPLDQRYDLNDMLDISQRLEKVINSINGYEF